MSDPSNLPREPPSDLPGQMRQVATVIEVSIALRPNAEHLREWADQIEQREKEAQSDGQR